MRRKRSFLPYWLRSREQHCAACNGPHSHAVSIRCTGCDRAFCSICVVTVHAEHLCPECSRERRKR